MTDNVRAQFHRHLDTCRECQAHPSLLCMTGQQLLRSAVCQPPDRVAHAADDKQERRLRRRAS